MKTNIYVDGFNFYYGCVKDTPYKWLDLGKLFKFLLPRDEINRIRYFTALVKPLPGRPDDGGETRQRFYMRALETIPRLTVHYGSFLTGEKEMIQAPIKGNSLVKVNVISTEEKGSDVSLATMLMYDCHKEEFDKAVVVTADSDFALPLEIARKQFGKNVTVLFPGENKSGTLRKVASDYRKINPMAVQVSQFPQVMKDWQGKFHKPKEW